MGRDKVGKRVKKGSRPKSSVKETGTLRGKFWIGDNEYMVVRYVLDNGLFRFYVKDIAEYLGIDNRRAYDVLQRLVARGWVRKIARGFYEFTADPIKIVSHYRVHSITGKIKSKVRRIAEAITKLFSQGKAHDTREPHRPVVRPVGLFFDNVRGFLRFSGRYVPGDDGFVRRPEDLVLFESISYSEIQYQVEGVEFPENAFLKIYTNYDQDGGNRVRVELAPPGGFIKLSLIHI